ncbi:MAG: hypothetical protein KDC93_08740 [Cyclobacteriaceae bacterium]|nr:hypothetical protein [Cyclobacteriaceae bacterium]
MKTLSIILISFFSFTASLFASNPDSVEIADSKRVDVMVLKFNKEQVGGQVVVLDSDGAEVSKSTIKRKRMIIDFDKVNFGAYKIKVVKEGAELAEFNYNKELILSQVVR